MPVAALPAAPPPLVAMPRDESAAATAATAASAAVFATMVAGETPDEAGAAAPPESPASTGEAPVEPAQGLLSSALVSALQSRPVAKPAVTKPVAAETSPDTTSAVTELAPAPVTFDPDISDTEEAATGKAGVSSDNAALETTDQTAPAPILGAPIPVTPVLIQLARQAVSGGDQASSAAPAGSDALPVMPTQADDTKPRESTSSAATEETAATALLNQAVAATQVSLPKSTSSNASAADLQSSVSTNSAASALTDTAGVAREPMGAATSEPRVSTPSPAALLDNNAQLAAPSNLPPTGLAPDSQPQILAASTAALGATNGSHLSQAAVDTTVQIAAQITRKLDGRSTRFEMGLTPEGLGEVDISLDIDSGGQLTARLAFDNPLAATEMRGRADELRRELQDAGFTIAQDGLDFSERQPSSGQGFDHRQSQAFAGGAQIPANTDLSQPAPSPWVSLSLAPLGVDLKV